jgi:hypothetical protein
MKQTLFYPPLLFDQWCIAVLLRYFQVIAFFGISGSTWSLVLAMASPTIWTVSNQSESHSAFYQALISMAHQVNIVLGALGE